MSERPRRPPEGLAGFIGMTSGNDAGNTAHK
jgi:hypothetical protein